MLPACFSIKGRDLLLVDESKKTSSFVKRHIVAAFAAPILISYLYFLPATPYFQALLIVVGMTALWEFYSMYKVPVKLAVPGVVIGGVLLYMFCYHPGSSLDTIFLSLFCLLMLRLFLVKTPSGSMAEMGPLIVGLFYIAGLLSFQWFLRIEELGREFIFLLYVSVWLSDSMALYIGTYMGKNKLYPAYSPNKTVEGAFGSLFGGMLGAVIIKVVFDVSEYSFPVFIIIGAIMGIAALVGDLVESMFKRDAGVKDSGTFIPGHGGIFDKIDGMLIAGPVLYLLVRYF